MLIAQPSETWLTANQRALMHEVALTRVSLEYHLGRTPEMPVPIEERVTTALDRICSTFTLSRFERHVLVACAAVELDGTFAALCALANGDSSRPYPTFGLALAAFGDAHWSALVPEGPLRRWSLVTVGRDGPLTSTPLRIDEGVLHELAGVEQIDARLRPYLGAPADVTLLVPSQCGIVEQIVRLMRGSESVRVLVQLAGPDPAATAAVAAAAFTALGQAVVVLDGRALPRESAELDIVADACSREVLLHHTAFCLDAHGLDETAEPGVIRLAERVSGAFVVGVDRPWPFIRRAAYTLSVARPTRAEQRDLWEHALETTGEPASSIAAALAAQFDFGAERIVAAAGAICAETGDLRSRAWAAAAASTRAGLDGIAQRLDTVAAAQALVLPPQQREAIADIVAHARNRMRVYEDWGMAVEGSRGLGLSALFHGPSGTGKTLAAEAIGSALALDVYRVDLSQLVSKYVGETEKNLRRVFDAAEGGGTVLLFDECDALFGKRGEIQYGHDRYANVEVSYLLQRMESYRGVAILTTNLRSALDPAFLRRIRFVVAFPFPDYDQRLAIWQRAFGPLVPTAGIDYAKLARLHVAGGSIRTIALHAAFLAAEHERPVRMADLLHAARAECVKIERTPSDVEIGAWV